MRENQLSRDWLLGAGLRDTKTKQLFSFQKRFAGQWASHQVAFGKKMFCTAEKLALSVVDTREDSWTLVRQVQDTKETDKRKRLAQSK